MNPKADKELTVKYLELDANPCNLYPLSSPRCEQQSNGESLTMSALPSLFPPTPGVYSWAMSIFQWFPIVSFSPIPYNYLKLLYWDPPS